MDMLGVHRILAGNNINKSEQIIEYQNCPPNIIRIPAKTASPIISSVPKCHRNSSKQPSRSHPVETMATGREHNMAAQSGLLLDKHNNMIFTMEENGLHHRQMADSGAIPTRGRGRLSSNNDNQVLLIVQDDNIKGGGIPIIGRRLPSKSINLDDSTYFHNSSQKYRQPRSSSLSKQKLHLDPISNDNDEQVTLINYKPTAASSNHLHLDQAPVVGRRTHRMLQQQQQQQQQIHYLNDDHLDNPKQQIIRHPISVAELDPKHQVYLLENNNNHHHKRDKISSSKSSSSKNYNHEKILSMINNQQANSMEQPTRIIEQYILPPMVNSFHGGDQLAAENLQSSSLHHHHHGLVLDNNLAKRYLLTEATTSKPQKLSTQKSINNKSSRSAGGSKLLNINQPTSSSSCTSLCSNQQQQQQQQQQLLLDCPHCYQQQVNPVGLSSARMLCLSPTSFDDLASDENKKNPNCCQQMVFANNSHPSGRGQQQNLPISYGLCCIKQGVNNSNSKAGNNMLLSSSNRRHLSEQNISNHHFVTTTTNNSNQTSSKFINAHQHHHLQSCQANHHASVPANKQQQQQQELLSNIPYCEADCNHQQQQYLLHNATRMIPSKPPVPLPAGAGNCSTKRFQNISNNKQSMVHRPSNAAGYKQSINSNNNLLLSEEATNVNQMYESLAAELKAKLGDPKMGPILLPPKDYDTMSRKQGKLNGIELRRSTNPQLVGPNINNTVIRQQTNNNPSKEDNNTTNRTNTTQEDIDINNSSLQRSRSISSSGLGSISMGATSNNSSPSSKASSSEDMRSQEQQAQQLQRLEHRLPNEINQVKRTSSDQTNHHNKQFSSTASQNNQIRHNNNNNSDLLSTSPLERKDYSPDNCAGSDSGHSGSARLDSALSNDEQSADLITCHHDNQSSDNSKNTSSPSSSSSSSSSHTSAINNNDIKPKPEQQKSLRGKGIHDYNPSKVSDGILWNGRVEIPLKVNSNKNDGNTYLATKQIIY